jgi:hypothetical protein
VTTSVGTSGWNYPTIFIRITLNTWYLRHCVLITNVPAILYSQTRHWFYKTTFFPDLKLIGQTVTGMRRLLFCALRHQLSWENLYVSRRNADSCLKPWVSAMRRRVGWPGLAWPGLLDRPVCLPCLFDGPASTHWLSGYCLASPWEVIPWYHEISTSGPVHICCTWWGRFFSFSKTICSSCYSLSLFSIEQLGVLLDTSGWKYVGLGVLLKETWWQSGFWRDSNPRPYGLWIRQLKHYSTDHGPHRTERYCRDVANLPRV